MYWLMLCNCMVAFVVRKIYYSDFNKKKSSKKSNNKHIKNTDKSANSVKDIPTDTIIITGVLTAYLIGTYAGAMGGQMRSTDMADRFTYYLNEAMIGILPFGLIASICAGYKRWWIILGTAIIAMVTYILMILFI